MARGWWLAPLTRRVVSDDTPIKSTFLSFLTLNFENFSFNTNRTNLRKLSTLNPPACTFLQCWQSKVVAPDTRRAPLQKTELWVLTVPEILVALTEILKRIFARAARKNSSSSKLKKPKIFVH